MKGQIIVSGGGGFWCGPEGLRLDEYALATTGKTRPKVCYIATAAGDSDEFIQGFYDRVGPLCEATHLPLFLPPFKNPAEALAGQDLIYVSGGNTANMLAVWRLHRIDELLAAALEAGTTLYGSSAGGLCWFDGGATDSLAFDGTIRALSNGLGFIDGSHGPHFDRSGRAQIFAELIRSGALPPGVGVDEFAAVRFVDGLTAEIVASVPGHGAHQVDADGIVSTTPGAVLR